MTQRLGRRGPNRDLTPLPTDDEVIAAVVDIDARRHEQQADARSRGIFYVVACGVSAADVAHALGVQAAQRLGNGAVQGSWSGYMSPALRIAPRLVSLWKRGELTRVWERGRYVYSAGSADA